MAGAAPPSAVGAALVPSGGVAPPAFDGSLPGRVDPGIKIAVAELPEGLVSSLSPNCR